MTSENVRDRLDLLREKMWPFEEIQKWYGVDLGTNGATPLLAQNRIWAEKLQADSGLFDLSGKRINRNSFELFLQDRELVCSRAAAISFGINEESFRRTMSAALVENLVSEAEAEGEFPNVYRASLIRDFHRRFPKLRYMIFSTFTGFVASVHQEIREFLGVEVTSVPCFTSQVLGLGPPEIARAYDIITNEPMALNHEIWLETRKPIQLRPDSCSWTTYFRFEEVLNEARLGSLDESAIGSRDVIREYFHI